MLIRRVDLFSIRRISEKIQKEVFDIRTQYKLLKLKAAADQEYKIFIEQLTNLSDKYGDKDEHGELQVSANGGVKVKPEFVKVFGEKLAQLEDLEVTVPDIYFTLDELQNLKLTMEELEPFMRMIK